MTIRFVIASALLAVATLTPALAPTTALAETVRVPVGSGAEVWQGETPRRGSTKSQVESSFGSPSSTHGPNGEPPIYFWEYPDFTVYFEHDHVIHTVIKHRPKG